MIIIIIIINMMIIILSSSIVIIGETVDGFLQLGQRCVAQGSMRSPFSIDLNKNADCKLRLYFVFQRIDHLNVYYTCARAGD